MIPVRQQVCFSPWRYSISGRKLERLCSITVWPPLPNADSPRPSLTHHLHLHVRFTTLHANSASLARFARICLFLEINAIQVYFLVSDDCIHLSELGDVTATFAIRMPCPALHLSPVFSPFSLTILSPSQ